MSARRARPIALLISLALVGGATSSARAQAPSPPALSEAGKHFQRGVMMYNEADYHAALVEFRRAYEIAPNPAVLYNIGQTYYQLQNYAAALTALGRYLTDAGPTAQHRREVEQTIDTLQTRVGKIAVTTTVPGCEITVDDEPIGKTPLDEPVLVSIGHRKVTALRDGRAIETHYVDVAAGDTVPLPLAISDAGARPPSSATSATATSDGRGAITTGWIVTGGLGAVALGAGVAAVLESRSLANMRNTFGVSSSDLDSKGTLVSRLSLVADIAGLAAIVAGGITLELTLSRSSSHEAKVAIAPNGIQIAGKF